MKVTTTNLIYTFPSKFIIREENNERLDAAEHSKKIRKEALYLGRLILDADNSRIKLQQRKFKQAVARTYSKMGRIVCLHLKSAFYSTAS